MSSIKGRFLVLALALLLPAFSLGRAQSLTFGLYGRLTPDYISPTLELSYPLGDILGDITLGLRAQRDAFGIWVESALDLGAGGRVAYGGRGNLGFAGWSLEGFAKGGLGPVALDASLAYSTAARSALWVGDSDPAGFSGLLSGRYRVSSTQTAGLSLSYSNPQLTTEATYALRDTATYTFGLGYSVGPYAVLGWRGELSEDGTLLEAMLRAGFRNELVTALSVPLSEESPLKLRLELAYALASSQFSGKLGAEYDALKLDATYDGGFSLWLRYTINLEE